jgi:hypothetical protein
MAIQFPSEFALPTYGCTWLFIHILASLELFVIFLKGIIYSLWWLLAHWNYDKVLVSARMRFWSRIKKVCRFLKKPRQNLCFLADDLASGHLSWSHFGNPAYISLPGIVCLCACISVHAMVGIWVVWISIPDWGLCSFHACAWAGASVRKSIHVSTHKNVEKLKMKLTKFPHCF